MTDFRCQHIWGVPLKQVFQNFYPSSLKTNEIFKIGKYIIRKNLRMPCYRGPPIMLAPPPIYYKS